MLPHEAHILTKNADALPDFLEYPFSLRAISGIRADIVRKLERTVGDRARFDICLCITEVLGNFARHTSHIEGKRVRISLAQHEDKIAIKILMDYPDPGDYLTRARAAYHVPRRDLMKPGGWGIFMLDQFCEQVEQISEHDVKGQEWNGMLLVYDVVRGPQKHRVD